MLCRGPPETGAYVTAIRLEHTLYTELASQQYPQTQPVVNPEPSGFGTTGGSGNIGSGSSINSGPGGNYYQPYQPSAPAAIQPIYKPQNQLPQYGEPTFGSQQNPFGQPDKPLVQPDTVFRPRPPMNLHPGRPVDTPINNEISTPQIQYPIYP